MPTSVTAVLEITSLLKAWGRGERSALDQLIPSIYAELRRIAEQHARRGRPDQTLHTTALVNEAYLRLIDVQGIEWRDRAHFFAVSSQIMRRILVDAARARATVKRGGAHRLNEITSFDWNAVPDLSAKRDRELIALDDALEELGKLDDRKRQVVEMRFFAGMNAEEAAETLRVSEKTVLRDWKLARAWLKREMARPRR